MTGHPTAGLRLRRAARFLHLAINGAWLGAVLCSLLFVVAGTPQDPAPYIAAFWLHDNVVVWVACAVVFTGLFFSLYTPWGLLRKRWIVGKWAGLLLLAVGIPFGVTPQINALAAQGDLSMATGQIQSDLAPLEQRVELLLWAELISIVSLFALSTWRPRGETGLQLENRRSVRLAVMTATMLTVGMSILGSAMLERARRTPLRMSSAIRLDDGCREGAIDWLGTRVRVQVDVRRERITALRVLEQPRGHYPELGALVADKVVAKGHLDVDGISGATTSARAVLVAASEALAAEVAGGE